MPKNINDPQFDARDLAVLMEKQVPGPCASIYMPASRNNVRENRIRFENLLKRIKRYSATLGAGTQTILGRAQLLVDDPFFWQNQRAGLAFFSTPAFGVSYRLPIVLPEVAVLGNRFHFKPLFQFLGENGVFYLLSLSRKNIRLYRGSRYGMSEAITPDLPAGLAEILPEKNFEKFLQSHGSGSRDGGELFHGHGGQKDARKTDLEKLFRKLDAALYHMLAAGKNPLILAGTGYFLPIYRAINTYPNLIQCTIEGNFDKPGSENPLYKAAWEIAERYFARSRKNALEKYNSMKGSSATSNDIKQIVAAAVNGLVETLLVAAGTHAWGMFDADTRQIVFHESEQPGDMDLLDFAAVHTFLHRGALYVVKQSEMPANAKIAAIARY